METDHVNDVLCLALATFTGRLEGGGLHHPLFANIPNASLDLDGGSNASDAVLGGLLDDDPSWGTSGEDEDIRAATLFDTVKFCLAGVVNPALCLFGLIGNVFNVLVLSRGRMKASLDCSMERAAHTGLVALAVSDILYCLSALCHSLVGRTQTVFPDRCLQMYVQVYGPYLQNIFLHTGTWLTVVMAAGRFAAICRPLQARHLVGGRSTALAVLFTFAAWIAVDLPRIWTYEIVVHDCPVPRSRYYILDHGRFVKNERLKTIFTYLWAVLGYLLPVLTLGYCNVHLIRALRESTRVRRLYRVGILTGSRISPTLVAIVCMYIVLVSPAELLHFGYYVIEGSDVELFSLAIVVTNLLQTLNFSVNFVLYCIVNVQFRRASRDLLLCAFQGSSSSSSSSSSAAAAAAATCRRSWHNSSASYVTRASLLVHSPVQQTKSQANHHRAECIASQRHQQRMR